MSYKAIAAANEIADALSKRLSTAAIGSTDTLAVTQSFDTDGNPLITVGTLGAGNACALLKVMDVPTPDAKDVFGNAAKTYQPVRLMILTEANPSGGAGADILKVVQFFPIAAEGPARGIRTEWYQVANGVAPSAGGLVVANLKATYDNIHWPVVSSQ